MTPAPRLTSRCPSCRAVEVPRHRFACRPCWFRLPADLRREITANYRRNPAVHLQAIRDGLRWYRDNPMVTPPAAEG